MSMLIQGDRGIKKKILDTLGRRSVVCGYGVLDLGKMGMRWCKEALRPMKWMV